MFDPPSLALQCPPSSPGQPQPSLDCNTLYKGALEKIHRRGSGRARGEQSC